MIWFRNLLLNIISYYREKSYMQYAQKRNRENGRVIIKKRTDMKKLENQGY